MIKDLAYYVHCFTHLRRDYKNGGAPHKPILLLSIINLFEKGVFINNQIAVIPELVATFKSIWAKLVITNHTPTFALPFYHMHTEPFWQLVANTGCEKWIESSNSMRSFGNLKMAVNYAVIDNELVSLLLSFENRTILAMELLEKYFAETKANFSYLAEDLPSENILREKSETYKKEIAALKQQVDDNAFQEEVFIRGGVFKREVPKIYNHTCAVSGLCVSAVTNVSIVDACHIVPFAEAYDDTLTNGIALCPNLHRAFDRGLISISDDYTILVNKNFVENTKSVFNISQFKGKQIILPFSEDLYPDLGNIAYHRKKYGF